MWWRKKTGTSNIWLIFLLKKARRGRATIKREARQSWADEVSKANERAVGYCGIHDWLTEGKLVVYPQYFILLIYSYFCSNLHSENGAKKYKRRSRLIYPQSGWFLFSCMFICCRRHIYFCFTFMDFEGLHVFYQDVTWRLPVETQASSLACGR